MAGFALVAEMTALINAERTAVRYADDRAGTSADCGGLLKIAGVLYYKGFSVSLTNPFVKRTPRRRKSTISLLSHYFHVISPNTTKYTT